LLRHVESFFRIGIRDLGEDALRGIEVIADDVDEYRVVRLLGCWVDRLRGCGVARLRGGDLRNLLSAVCCPLSVPPPGAGDECDGEHGGEAHRPLPGSAAAAFEAPAEAVPDLLGVAFRHRERVDEREHAAERGVLRATFGAGIEMRRRIDVAIVMADQFFVVQVLHGFDLTNGSRASRSFRTARKIVCFVALTWMPSVLPISSTGIPSKWRSTNAVRSLSLRRFIAAATCCCSSALSAMRSGSGASELGSSTSTSPPYCLS